MAFLGGLGRGLLKVAKFAEPGINMLPGGKYINAGIDTLDDRFNQGMSWGDSARQGLGEVGGALANRYISKIPNAGVRDMAQGAMQGYGGQQYGGMNRPSIISDDPARGGITGNQGGYGVGPSLQGIGQAIGRGIQNMGQRPVQPMGQGQGQGQGIGPSPMAMQRMDQSNPNLAYAIQAGRQTALMNQPWRQQPPMLPSGNQLPPVYPNMNTGLPQY